MRIKKIQPELTLFQSRFQEISYEELLNYWSKSFIASESSSFITRALVDFSGTAILSRYSADDSSLQLPDNHFFPRPPENLLLNNTQTIFQFQGLLFLLLLLSL